MILLLISIHRLFPSPSHRTMSHPLLGVVVTTPCSRPRSCSRSLLTPSCSCGHEEINGVPLAQLVSRQALIIISESLHHPLLLEELILHSSLLLHHVLRHASLGSLAWLPRLLRTLTSKASLIKASLLSLPAHGSRTSSHPTSCLRISCHMLESSGATSRHAGITLHAPATHATASASVLHHSSRSCMIRSTAMTVFEFFAMVKPFTIFILATAKTSSNIHAWWLAGYHHSLLHHRILHMLQCHSSWRSSIRTLRGAHSHWISNFTTRHGTSRTRHVLNFLQYRCRVRSSLSLGLRHEGRSLCFLLLAQNGINTCRKASTSRGSPGSWWAAASKGWGWRTFRTHTMHVKSPRGVPHLIHSSRSHTWSACID
mmetsp:Transcript_21599/g.48913  ORF Transcript_21599/g.48913 Transcript_21599/m.48913 type:complete len:371 (+) Transcript_21599:57-1169(+)